MSSVMDVKSLIGRLGPEGARTALRDGELTLAELTTLAKARGLPLAPKPTRDEIANELAYEEIRKIEKNLDELTALSQEELLQYFKQKKPTLTELLSILSQLGIRPGSEDRKHLLRFAAREISEIGMFQRVAHGTAATGAQRT